MAAHNSRWHGLNMTRPTPVPASASKTDRGDPRISERNRGGRTAGGVVRRRWLLQRRQRCQRVRLTQAHLGEPFIAANDSARGVVTSTAAHGHGRAGSDDATTSQPDKATLRASAALLEPSARQRRDGKGARTAGRVERQLRRGQPWRRWKKTDDSPLPRLD